jgi:hypothetical protein
MTLVAEALEASASGVAIATPQKSAPASPGALVEIGLF